MAKSDKSSAETKLFASAARDAAALAERHAEQKRRSNKIDRLRALRLQKEAEEAEAKKLVAEEKKAKPKRAKKAAV